MTRQFNTDSDVRKHFARQAQLGTTPEPPRDLWEEIDRIRREAVRRPGRKSHAPTEPDLKSLSFPKLTWMQRMHPVAVVESVNPAPDVRPPARKTYKLKAVT